MRKKELKLTDIPGDYLSKEDFYKIAHISKRTALWLIETELVLAERPEKQGLGYRIPKAEVERYLADRSINPTKYRRSDRCNRYGIKSNSHGHLWCNNNNWRCIGDEESPHCEGNSITVHLAVGRQFALNCLPTEYTSIVSLKSLLPIF